MHLPRHDGRKERVMELYYTIGGYIIGVVAAWCIIQPAKLYSQGYKEAASLFKDWDRGFEAGWNACEKHTAERSEE